MASYCTMSSARQSDESMDDNDDKDDTKRKSRNLSEKKRRDQFNMLVNELSNMVSANARKVDKSTVLKSTILFLKNHNEIAVKSRVHEIEEEWKPSFFSNEEFTHLILEALDGFIMVFSSSGRIYYASESVTSLLGYLPSELVNATIYEITYQDDQSHLYNVLLNTGNNQGSKEGNKVTFTCHMKRGGLDFREEDTYELVQFNGYFRSDSDIETLIPNNRLGNNVTNDTKLVFVGTGRLQTPQLIRDMSFIDSTQSEFTSRHSFEWKFLFLDHRAPPIIGYLPFEVLGTSGYDYYHVDDLDKVVTCHESVMLKGEGTSCHYRFLTKGQQWIWLQTRFYIDYNQWNSKPEFIVCTHNVVSYTDVIKQRKNGIAGYDSKKNQSPEVNQTSSRSERSAAPCQVQSSAWSPKASRPSRLSVTRSHYYGGESDTNSVSASSQSSRQSVSTTHSFKPKVTPSNSIKSFHEPKASPKLRKSAEVDQSYTNYVEPQRFATEPTTVVPTFIAPATPTVPNQLSNNTALVNQQNVAMPNVQVQIQDELQRKHEELQQLIVQQQEELRRVSEQLLVARYGILSPLINVGLQFNQNSCQQATTCGTVPNGSVTDEVPTDSIVEMNVHPVPVTPVPIVPIGTFPLLSMAVPVDHISVPLMPQQQQQQRQNHQHQQLQRHGQHQHPHHQSQTTNQDQAAEIMPYQICPPNDIIYGNVDTAMSAQQRQTRN